MAVLVSGKRGCAETIDRMATERGFDRLVNFSDAVVAIAATLLVLPFVDNATQATRGKVDATILDFAPEFLIFVLSFIVVTRFWFSHHQFFERLVGYSSRLVWFNLMWLLGIVIMPFPTQLVAIASNTDKLAVLVYLGTMFWIAFWQFMMGVEVHRQPRLLAANENPSTGMIISAVIAGLLLVAMLISLIWPGVALWSLTSLVFVPFITKPLLRRSARAAGVSADSSSASAPNSHH